MFLGNLIEEEGNTSPASQVNEDALERWRREVFCLESSKKDASTFIFEHDRECNARIP